MKSLVTALIPALLLFGCGSNSQTENDNLAENNTTEQDTATANDEKVEPGMAYDNMGFKTEEYMLWPNGNVRIIGKYIEGKRNGIWTAYFESGIKNSENEYAMGEKHGKSAVWHPNGQLYYLGYYEHNEKKGIWKFYDENGNLVTTEDYGK